MTALLLVVIVRTALGQAATIAVAEPALVSADAPSGRHAETVLAVNPRDPRNLVIGAIRLGEPMRTVVYFSHDGGRQWSRGRGADGAALADSTDDPTLVFDQRGRAYFAARATTLLVRRSRDGGRTWDSGVEAPGRGPDRPWLQVIGDQLWVVAKQSIGLFDASGSPDVILLSRANLSDQGEALRFSGPRLRLPRWPARSYYFHATHAVARGPGDVVTLMASECDLPEQRGPRLQCRLLAIVSLDGGRTFAPAVTIADVERHTHADAWSMIKGLGLGALAVDGSDGPTRGRMYATWSDLRNGRYQTVVAVSADTGRTWMRPVVVNDDTTRANHSTPGVAVNGAGVVGLAWYDRRNDPADDCFRPFFAASLDGGRTFTPSVAISRRDACPATPGGKPTPERFGQGGDTFGVAATPDGAFHLAWVGPSADADPQTWRLFVTRVVVQSSR